MLQTGLKDVEGKVLGQFGLGKHDGSSDANALYVRVANGGGGLGGGLTGGGGSLGKLGNLGGFGSDTSGITGQGGLSDDSSIRRRIRIGWIHSAGSFGVVGERARTGSRWCWWSIGDT